MGSWAGFVGSWPGFVGSWVGFVGSWVGFVGSWVGFVSGVRGLRFRVRVGELGLADPRHAYIAMSGSLRSICFKVSIQYDA